MPTFQRHIFVCTNERDKDHPRGSCKRRGSEDVRDAFKKAISSRGLKTQVRANAAGCLDQCELGVAVVVYPEQVWYGGVTVGDVDEIVERHILGGEPVQRLLMPSQPQLDHLEHLPVLTPQAKDGKDGKEPKLLTLSKKPST